MTAINLSSDTLHVRILPRGAALVGVRLKPQARNLVLGFANPTDHMTIPVYAGAIVGPIANRISDGRIVMEGKTLQMERNEKGSTALHSGAAGLHAHLWEIASQSAAKVTLTTTLKDGDGGLPGHRKVTALYEITDTTLQVEITATTNKPTPMNIAAHPYWKLDGQLDVSGHTLRVDTSRITPTDSNNIPTGEVTSTDNTLFDFETLKPVPLDAALDINFCLATAPRPKPVHAATLVGGDGTRLDITTTAPGLQVYNGAHLPALNGVLDGGGRLTAYGAIALEPQFWPDAPNIAAFPQITLMPGEIWRQVTTYRLTPAP